MSNFLNFVNFIERVIQNETINSSFEQQPSSQPTDTKFMNNLETLVITESDLAKQLHCAICQENFKQGEKIIKLPCKDGPHYFHCNMDKDICEGILPWLEKNNTCPICRHEFPKLDIENSQQENQESSENEQSQQEINRQTQVNLMESFVRLQNVPRRGPLPSTTFSPQFTITPHANVITLPIPINFFERINNHEYDSDLQEAIRRSLDEQ